ncbi:hypothetical protein AMK59_5105, partial [Oryctes borbonicus]
APSESPSVHMSRSRSKSLRRSTTDHRSLSPPDVRVDYPAPGYGSARFQSRSATATPTGSPKKRQLPQVPNALARALQERVTQDLEERSMRTRGVRYQQVPTYRISGSGWEQRRYSGLSDSDLTTHTRTRKVVLSPDRDREPLGGTVDFDSDMESVASVTSSAFSTQSERPRGNNRVVSGEYPSGGGSDRYSYGGGHRQQPPARMPRERIEVEIRDPMETMEHHHHQYHHVHHREGSVKRGTFTRSLSNNETPA